MKKLWLFIFGILIFSTKNQASPSTFFEYSNLPIIINTGGQTIMDKPKVIVDMGVIYNSVGMTNHRMTFYNNLNGEKPLNSVGFLHKYFLENYIDIPIGVYQATMPNSIIKNGSLS